jgi:hypothetical protein
MPFTVLLLPLGPLRHYFVILFHTPGVDVLCNFFRQCYPDTGYRGQGPDTAVFIGLLDIEGVIGEELRGLAIGSYLKRVISPSFLRRNMIVGMPFSGILGGKSFTHLREHFSDDLVCTHDSLVLAFLKKLDFFKKLPKLISEMTKASALCGGE